MKILGFGFALFFSCQLFASISILSDLDDTIKITQSGDLTDVFGSDIFIGMPEFFLDAQSYSNELHILSASPGILREKIKKTLNDHSIAYETLTLRENLFERKFEYKVRVIEKLFETTSDSFIFLGDDLGQDPEVYAEIQRRYPSRVLATYIHVINGRQFSTDAELYWTTFDLALREHLAGRMSLEHVKKMASKFIFLAKLDSVFPEKAQCPTVSTVWDWQLTTDFWAHGQVLIQKFINYCQQRQSDIISP